MATVGLTTANNKQVANAIKGQLYDALRKELAEPDKKTKKSFMQTYIESMLQEAQKNPNSPVGQLVAKQLMQEDIINKIDDATDRFLARDIDFNEYRLLKTLYNKQQTVYNDNAQNIAAICSRRVGKTELAARLLVKDALHPNHHAIYFALRFDSAIRQCYVLVDRLIKDLGIPVAHQSKSDGIIELSNGSDIVFRGNSNRGEADRNLGGKWSLAILDEIQNQCQPEYLIDVVLRPGLKDYNGRLVLLGTPPRIPHTYIEKVWEKYEGWVKYNWTMFENPFVNKGLDEYLDNICKEKGVTRDAPFIQREYFGRFGIWDFESMVIKDPLLYDGDIEKLIKEGKFHADYVYGGIDWGGTDYNGIVTVAWDHKQNIGYILKDYKFNQATATEIIEKCKESLGEAQNVLSLSGSPISNVNYYADHNVKSLVFELQNNYNFPIQLAYKHDKDSALDVLGDLCRYKIYTPEKSHLKDEYDTTVHPRDEETDAILPGIDPACPHPDVLDALLYASRAIVQFENPLGKDQAYPGDGNLEEVKPEDEVDFTDEIE